MYCVHELNIFMSLFNTVGKLIAYKYIIPSTKFHGKCLKKISQQGIMGTTIVYYYYRRDFYKTEA